MKKKIFRAGLLVLSFLATVKIVFLGLGIDEEYAVTMAYRILSEDRMFLEMWEPHQTSGFLSALFIGLFVTITGSAEGVIVYLRIVGACLQALVSLFLYRTLKKEFSEEVCFAAAVFFYNTLPKWIQTPEFANMLMWFGTLTFLCLFRFYSSEGKYQKLWLLGAAVSICGMVLSYPSCILAVPVILFGIYRIRKGKKGLKEAGIVFGVCAVLGISYLCYFLSHMTLEEFFYGLQQMATDGSHGETFVERLIVYAQEIKGLVPYLAAAFSAAAVMALLPVFRSCRGFCAVMLIVVMVQQMIYWIGDGEYLQRPLLYYHVLYAAGILLYCRKAETAAQAQRVLFYTGSLAGGAIWLTALIITNTTISVTGSYLMPGILSGILLLGASGRRESLEYRKGPERILVGCAILGLLGVTLFAKGFLVCSVEGRKDDVTLVRQKALSGPAKYIYCRYMDGYAYNETAEFLEEYLQEECAVLYVGKHSLYYLLQEQTICNYSTISTPTFDGRLAAYWEHCPERLPKYVLCDSREEDLQAVEELLVLGKLVAQQELANAQPIRLYEVTGIRR